MLSRIATSRFYRDPFHHPSISGSRLAFTRSRGSPFLSTARQLVLICPVVVGLTHYLHKDQRPIPKRSWLTGMSPFRRNFLAHTLREPSKGDFSCFPFWRSDRSQEAVQAKRQLCDSGFRQVCRALLKIEATNHQSITMPAKKTRKFRPKVTSLFYSFSTA
jgi:hypothetical protein